MLRRIFQFAASTKYQVSLSTIPVQEWIILWETPFISVDIRPDIVSNSSVCRPNLWIILAVRWIKYAVSGLTHRWASLAFEIGHLPAKTTAVGKGYILRHPSPVMP
jgi:hypothetical protein